MRQMEIQSPTPARLISSSWMKPAKLS
ncbi:hypothetical protein Godav_021762, partial [Gossypium davidsonii]|nr:hypothetical protein [Gossypium davidsonii]